MIINEKITLTGPKNELENVKSAYVSVDINDKSDDINGNYEIILLDKNGVAIKSENIQKDKTTINITSQILKIKEVPLSVTLDYGDIIPRKAISGYSIDVPSIKILGLPKDVDAINSINLGVINVDEVATGKLKFELTPPELTNIKYYEEKDQKFTVTIELADYISEEYLVTNFLMPEISEDFGKEVTIQTTELTIKVYSSENALKELTSEDIQIKPVFIENDLVDGLNEVVCQIIINKDGEYDIVNEYKIVLEVK